MLSIVKTCTVSLVTLLAFAGPVFAQNVPSPLAAYEPDARLEPVAQDLRFGLRLLAPNTEFWVCLAALALMAGVALAAAWIPVRNASRVDPMEALRYE